VHLDLLGVFTEFNYYFCRTPHKLVVVLSRRSRRFVSEALPWEPMMKDPLKGLVIWPVPENKQLSVTLFKDPRTNEHEDKEWTFSIEDVSAIIQFFLCTYSQHSLNFHPWHTKLYCILGKSSSFTNNIMFYRHT